MTLNKERTQVRSVETALNVIQVLDESEGASITEIADEVGVGTSTVHRHLVTLHDQNYIVKEEGKYRLGLMFLTHGGKTRKQVPNTELIQKKLENIVEETGERAQFIIEEHGQRVYVFTRAGENAVRTDATVGKRGPLHSSAAGKAILANLPEKRTEEILETQEFDGITDKTITDREKLEAELEEVRKQGYAFNEEESTDRLHAVGVPVRHNTDHVLGALSISGPAHRLKDEYFREELPNLLLGISNEIELNLEYM